MCEYWLHSCGHTTKTPCPRPKQIANLHGQQSRNPSDAQSRHPSNASTARNGSNASSILTPSTPSDSSTINFTNPFASGLANALAACKDRVANNPANSCKGMPDEPRESQDPCYPCVLEDAQRKTLEEGPEVEEKLAQVKRDGFYQRGRRGWADDAYGVDGMGGQSGGYGGFADGGGGGQGGFAAAGGGFRGHGGGRSGYANRDLGGRGGQGGFDHGGFGPGPRGGFVPVGFGRGGFAPADGHGTAFGQDTNGYNDFGGGDWGRGGFAHAGDPAHAAFHGNNGFHHQQQQQQQQHGGFVPQPTFGPGPGVYHGGGGFFLPTGIATPGMVPATPAMVPNGMVDHGMFGSGPQGYAADPQSFPSNGFAPNGFGGNPYGSHY